MARPPAQHQHQRLQNLPQQSRQKFWHRCLQLNLSTKTRQQLPQSSRPRGGNLVQPSLSMKTHLRQQLRRRVPRGIRLRRHRRRRQDPQSPGPTVSPPRSGNLVQPGDYDKLVKLMKVVGNMV